MVGSRARRIMTHRCTVQRDENLNVPDDWNDQLEPVWRDHLTDLPCRWWFEPTASITDVQDERLADITQRRMIVPLGTDVHEDDRVLNVRDRRGIEIADGPMRIDNVGNRPDHMVLKLVDVR